MRSPVQADATAAARVTALRMRRGAELGGARATAEVGGRIPMAQTLLVGPAAAVQLARIPLAELDATAVVRGDGTAEWYGQGAIVLPDGDSDVSILREQRLDQRADRAHLALIATEFASLASTPLDALASLATYLERGSGGQANEVAAALAQRPVAIARLVRYAAEKADDRAGAARVILRVCGDRCPARVGAEALRTLVPALANASVRIELATLGARLIAMPCPERLPGDDGAVLGDDGVSPGSRDNYSVQVHHPFHTVCHRILLGTAPSTVPILCDEAARRAARSGARARAPPLAIVPRLAAITAALAATAATSEASTPPSARRCVGSSFAEAGASRRIAFARAVVRQCHDAYAESIARGELRRTTRLDSPGGSSERSSGDDDDEYDSSTTESEWSADEVEEDGVMAYDSPRSAARRARSGGGANDAAQGGAAARRRQNADAAAALDSRGAERPWHIPILEIGHADAGALFISFVCSLLLFAHLFFCLL